MEKVRDGSIDLIIMDPPYQMETSGGGSFGPANRSYHSEIAPMCYGTDNDLLDLLWKKMKEPNLYIWCNKAQLRQYIDYGDDRGCNLDLLTWHKTNPVPTCHNKYLSDTEYLLFLRGKGVPLYGTYESKRKWWATPTNKDDKDRWHHPSIKPLSIIQTLVTNSTLAGQTVLDPFLGSGTTAVACQNTGRNCIGFEIDPIYYQTVQARLEAGL